MTFRLSINCDNAAFADNGHKEEIARILQDLASKITDYRRGCREGGLNERLVAGEAVSLYDVNGNPCGTVTLEVDQ